LNRDVKIVVIWPYNKIGVFDSGIGGFSVLGALRRLLPCCDYYYLADSGNLPYGSKTREEIREYSIRNVRFFNSLNVDCVFVACNTSASSAMDLIEAYSNFPVYNILDVAAYGIKNISVNREDKYTLIATERTIEDGVYIKIMEEAFGTDRVKYFPTPELVDIIEKNYNRKDVLADSVYKVFKNIDIDMESNLILGCTHYPFLLKEINKFWKGEIINPSEFFPDYINSRFKTDKESCEYRDGEIIAYTSGKVSEMYLKLRHLSIDYVKDVNYVQLENYSLRRKINV